MFVDARVCYEEASEKDSFDGRDHPRFGKGESFRQECLESNCEKGDGTY